MKKKLKIGIIGAGAIARRAHIPTWLSIPTVEITMIADKNLELANKVANEFSISRYTEDYLDILSNSLIDIVDICTPTPLHYEMIIKSIDYGKHILVEKPLTLDLKESLVIKKKLKQREDLKLCVVQNYRYINCVNEVKKIINAGRLGNIDTIHGKAFTFVPVAWNRSKWLYHKYAVLYDFCPHLIDLALFFIKDEIKRVFAVGKSFSPYANFLASSQILIELYSGIIILLDISWVKNAPKFELEIYGNGGYVYLNLFRDFFWEGHGSITPLDEIRIFKKKFQGYLSGILRRDLSIKQYKAYLPFFQDFIKSIIFNKTPPVDINQAIITNLVLEAAKKSIELRKSISVSLQGIY